MTTVTVQALWYKSCHKSLEGMPLEESLEAPRKTDIEGVDVTCWGRKCECYFVRVKAFTGARI